jgi:hypothetical protein
MGAHDCNSTYSRGRDQKDHSLTLHGQNVSKAISQQITEEGHKRG